MSANVSAVDVIHSPWCFIEAPEESYKREMEEKWNIRIREYNLWEIEDDEVDVLPNHVLQMIRGMRNPESQEDYWHAGGSVFFLNGEKLDLSPALKWPQVEALLAQTRQNDAEERRDD